MNCDKNTGRQAATKQKLFDSLMRLLKKKSIGEINVTELAREAKISRMAFYRNYSIIPDVLQEYLSNNLFGGNITTNEVKTNGIKAQLILYFVYLRDNKTFMQTLFDSNLLYMIMEEIGKMIDKFYVVFDEKLPTHSMALSIIRGAIYSMTIDWIKSDMSKPPEEMGKALYSVANLVILNFAEK